MDPGCGPWLWILPVDPACGPWLWTLPVDPGCGFQVVDFLKWILVVDSGCGFLEVDPAFCFSCQYTINHEMIYPLESKTERGPERQFSHTLKYQDRGKKLVSKNNNKVQFIKSIIVRHVLGIQIPCGCSEGYFNFRLLMCICRNSSNNIVSLQYLRVRRAGVWILVI